MKIRSKFLAVFILTAAPLSAQEFTARNGVTVAAVGKGFNVTGDAGIGARGVWCGAADYARSVKGATGAQRLYIAEDRKRGFGQRGPVTFTLDPNGLTPSSTVIVGGSLGRAGANLSVGHAFGFCADHKLQRAGGRF
ncbi:hypothetical protein [Sulfitobacter guttiformis]|uniref:Uncharacterized protein n=1 Tax=Sulfitobacter guttiformis TaxID=74349 RepID=A0A420DNR6_9RHOB|nr:hypothetical protein [Sulfitobacter guttiformis]KIN73168.1 hypothetical protein Z949_2353 [Sulfitobacter guttiformis KCTC 32187]RKE95850.1 hypothetical protein C8N30_0394 [Sulfitobacter guttiformis]